MSIYYWCDEIKDVKMGNACSKDDGDDKLIQN